MCESSAPSDETYNCYHGYQASKHQQSVAMASLHAPAGPRSPLMSANAIYGPIGGDRCDCGYTLYATRADVTNGTCYDDACVRLQARAVHNADEAETRDRTSQCKQTNGTFKVEESSKQNVDNALQELLQSDGYQHFAENSQNGLENGQIVAEIDQKSVDNLQPNENRTLVVRPMTSSVAKTTCSLATSSFGTKSRRLPNKTFSDC